GYDYSSEGYQTQVHFYDRNGNPTPGEDGAFIKQKKRDKFGRVIEFTSLWKDARPMNDMNGEAGTRAFYDDQGNRVREENIDAAGNPVDPKGQDYRATMSYDHYGNIAEAYFQKANEDFSLTFGTCKISRSKPDDHGNPIESQCVRQNGELSKTGFAITRNEFDANGQLVKSEYFDGDGHPVLGLGGSFRDTVSYDADGNVTEVATYDTDGKPIVNNGGFHKKIWEFKNRHENRNEYRDVDGRRVAPHHRGAAPHMRNDAQ